MYELYTLIQTKDFEKAVFLVPTGGLKIHRDSYVEEYKKHWETESRKLLAAATKTAEEARKNEEEAKLFQRFIELFPKLVSTVQTFLIKNFEDLKAEGFRSLKSIVWKSELPLPTSSFTGRERIVKELYNRLGLLKADVGSPPK